MKVISNSKLCGEYDQRFIPLNRAFYFDGATYLSIAALSTNVVSDGIFSISMWVKPGEVVGTQHRPIWSFYVDGNNRIYMKCPSDSTTSLSIYSVINSSLEPQTVKQLENFNWFQLVSVFSNATWIHYINGAEVLSETKTDLSTLVGTPNFKIGAYDTFRFKGHLAGINVYNKALSPSEVTNLYNGVAVSGAVASYPYWTDADKAAGTGVTDWTGNGNNLTLTGNANIYAYTSKDTDIEDGSGNVCGPNLVQNGGFDSADNWFLQAGWTIGGGVATHTAGSAGYIRQAVNIEIGKTYIYSFDVIWAAGVYKLDLGGFDGSGYFGSGGAKTGEVTVNNPSSVAYIFFYVGADFSGSIDNLVIREKLK